MAKFIELHHKGKPHLLNVDRIVEVKENDSNDNGGSIVYQDTENELMVYVDEEYETVKSLLAGEKPLKVTAEEIEEARDACDRKECTDCAYRKEKDCVSKFIADYINGKVE